MKTNWQHQKDAITTDQKTRAEDEHLLEVDKRHLKESREKGDQIPRKTKPGTTDNDVAKRDDD